MAAGWLDLPDRRLEYTYIKTGKPVGIPVVLLHEGLGCVRLWKDFPQRLAHTLDRDIVVYSRRGYGRSSPVQLPRPMNYLEGDGRAELESVLQASRLDKVILLGHSDGATIALAAAAHDRTGAIAATITLAPHVFAESMTRNAIRTAVEHVERGHLARYHADNVDGAFRGWSDTWLSQNFTHWNIVSLLPDISCPTLLIQGRNDEYASYAQIRCIAENVYGTCRRRMLARCGHTPQFQRPAATLAMIKQFIAPLA